MNWLKEHPFYETILYFFQGAIIGWCGSFAISYGTEQSTLIFGLLLLVIGSAFILYPISRTNVSDHGITDRQANKE